jgi:hypothetical protein
MTTSKREERGGSFRHHGFRRHDVNQGNLSETPAATANVGADLA